MSQRYKKEYKEGYTPRLVMEEASRCLLCLDAPCSKACPAGTDPAKFIRSVRFLNFKGAVETVRINNPLGGICARVCPTERYCQKGCSRCGIDKPIDIGLIQRYVTDFEDNTKMNVIDIKEKNDKKVAIVGSGPGGLSLAALLAKDGYQVDIYEKEKSLGGYLRYGIPEYRLPTEIVDKEIDRIIKLGVNVHLNTKIGKDISLEELKNNYSAVVLAIGQSKGKTLSNFANNEHVITAVELLKQIKSHPDSIKVKDNALIIGGGDVAMDVATSLKLLGFKFVQDVVYETFEEFKASKEEKETALKEGVSIIEGYVPLEVNDNVVTFKHRMLDSEIKIKSNLIVLAVGQEVEHENIDVEFERNEVKEKAYRLKDSNLFYVGDIAHQEKTVVYAIRTAKEVAYEIKKYLGGK
ncbi:MAG: FAD-dependent oxidoreductase [Bacilli bacterium]